MTFESAVRQALAEMTIPEAPHRRGDVATAARHVNVCSYCALKLHERLAELMGNPDVVYSIEDDRGSQK